MWCVPYPSHRREVKLSVGSSLPRGILQISSQSTHCDLPPLGSKPPPYPVCHTQAACLECKIHIDRD